MREKKRKGGIRCHPSAFNEDKKVPGERRREWQKRREERVVRETGREREQLRGDSLNGKVNTKTVPWGTW